MGNRTEKQKQEEGQAAKSTVTIQSMVQNYNARVTHNTTGHERLDISYDLVTNLTQRLSEGSVSVSHQECQDIISSLLRVTLNAEHTTSDLQEFLLSPDVVTLVRSLITATGDAGVILKGMIDGVMEEGVGIERFQDYGARLLNSWFTGDNYKPPTSPGFVLEIFLYKLKCLDRQEEVAGKRHIYINTVDELLLPLVVSVINTETRESINTRDYLSTCRVSALHYNAALLRLPSVTRELLKHPGIDVNVRNSRRHTPLLLLVWEGYILDESHPPICSLLLSHPDTDVSISDNDQKTVIHHLCQHLTKPGSDTEAALQMIQEVCQHKTVTMEMKLYLLKFVLNCDNRASIDYDTVLPCIIIHLLTHQHEEITKYLFEAGGLAKLQDIILNLKVDSLRKCGTLYSYLLKCIRTAHHTRVCYEFLLAIINLPSFPVNEWLYENCTIGHLLAKSGNKDLMGRLLDNTGYDVNKADGTGNSVLFYICEHFLMEVTRSMLTNETIGWDFSVTNDVGQTVYDYYKCLKTAVHHPYIEGLLQKKCSPKVPAPVADHSQYKALLPVHKHVRPVHWRVNPPLPASVLLNVKPTTRQEYQATITQAVPEIYVMDKARKGSVCIVCVTEFMASPQILYPLHGYHDDVNRLVTLWTQLGFDVHIPHCCPGSYQLTAGEMTAAVTEFSARLQEADQCAVLCILSHGGEGVIYGSDGNTVRIQDLVRLLDNHRCINMAQKPKLILVQACQGTESDVGIQLRTGPECKTYIQAAGPTIVSMPTVSDVIVIMAAMQGYASFTGEQSTTGSTMINALTRIFAEHAHNMDIDRMLTLVNKEVSKADISVTDPKTRSISDRKQMPCFISCLTKLLYFLPCPGGKNGQNW